MTINQLDETELVGKREDLADILTNISPVDTPCQSNFGKATAKNTEFSWLRESLRASVDNNAKIDGADFSHVEPTQPQRLRNYCQIVREDLEVSRRANKSNTAGRKQELAHSVIKTGKALKNDLEKSLTANQAAVVSQSAQAPRTAGLGAWLATHADRGEGGADPALSDGLPNAAATDGDLRAPSFDGLAALHADLFVGGGRPKMIMVYPTVQQKLSQYFLAQPQAGAGRIAVPQMNVANGAKGLSVVGAVDAFRTDFGLIEVVTNLNMRSRDIFMLDPELFDLCYFDDWQTTEIPEAGDAKRRMVLVDVGLRSREEAGSAIYADVAVTDWTD